jgi:hypothetical protein
VGKVIKSKKGIALLAALVVAIAAAVGAYAYFTSTGTGTGSASVGSATNWVVGQTGSTGGALYPDAAIGGANVQTKSYHVKNAGSGSQSLSQVVISIANADGSVWSSQADPLKPACKASDFSVGGEAVGASHTDTALAGDFTAGQDKTTGSVTVEMIDNNANQDNCQGVTVPLYFSAS